MPRLNLEHQRKRARALLKGVRANDPQALRRLRACAGVPALTDVSLADAQRVVARERGFPNWARLKAQVRAECLARPLMRAALVAAAHYALETERPRPLFQDPYACALAGDEGRALVRAMAQTTWPGFGATSSNPYIAITTKFFDDALQRVVRESDIRQIVVLGAGMDTRAFRLSWPSGVTIFELDRPDVFDHKERVLEFHGARSRCRRQTVAADPHGPWAPALLKCGFDEARPAAFLAQRLEYFSAAAADRLRGQVTTIAAPGSWVGFAVNTDETNRSPFLAPFVAKLQSLGLPPWTFGLDDPDAWLTTCGWTATSIVLGAPEANYGRWPMRHVPRETPAIPRTFVTQGWRDREEATCVSR